MDINNAPIANQNPLGFPISPASLKQAALASLLLADKTCLEYMLKNWDLVKDSISVELFSHLLNDLCFDAYICQKEASFGHEKFAHVSTTILNVWITAPNELKMKYFHSSDYVEKLFIRLKDAIGTEIMDTYWQPRVCYKHNLSFFLQLFSDMPLEMRSKVWRDYWLLFVARSRSETLTCLLSLCLVDQDDIQTFIVIEMLDFTKIQTIVESWWDRRLFYEVIDYSNLCSWDIQLVREFRRHIFSVFVPSLEAIDSAKLWEVYPLIRNRFGINESNSLQTALSHKYDSLQDLLVEKLERGAAEVVFWLMERFTPTKRSSREKQILSSHWFDFLTIKQIGQDFAARWREFSSWWQCEADDCSMFKRFLSVDDIFHKLLLRVVQKLTLCLGPAEMDRAEPVPSQCIRMEEFELVDDFLTWYHCTEIAAKNYKLHKLSNYEECPWLATLLNANNECLVNDLLRWFFNGDLVEMVHFKDEVIKKTYGNVEIPVIVID